MEVAILEGRPMIAYLVLWRKIAGKEARGPSDSRPNWQDGVARWTECAEHSCESQGQT